MTFAQQIRHEDEGAAANIAGKPRDACPYDRDAQSFAWNHWVYGWDIAESERLYIEAGTVTFYVTSSPEPAGSQPLSEAVARGLVRFRYRQYPPAEATP